MMNRHYVKTKGRKLHTGIEMKIGKLILQDVNINFNNNYNQV